MAGDGKIANLFYSVSQGDKEVVGCDSIIMNFSVQIFMKCLTIGLKYICSPFTVNKQINIFFFNITKQKRM